MIMIRELLFRLSPRFRITQINADSPFAAHNKGGLLFIVDDWPGEIFTLWFPEFIGAFGLPLRSSVDWMKTQKWNFNESKEHAWQSERTESYEYKAEIKPIKEGLILTLTIINLTDKAFLDGWVNICLRCCHAPSFNDADLTRTFLSIEGEWVPLRSVATLDHRKQHRLILSKEYSKNLVMNCGGMENVFIKQCPDCNLIAVTDDEGKRTVGFFSEKCAGFVVNGMEDMRCIHSNPSLPYEIKSGETAKTKCAILLMNKPLQEAARFIKTFEIYGLK